MKDISERVSYLQGLSEGLNISAASPQGKIISGILGVLEEIADEVVAMQYELDTVHEYVESLDDDLFDLEELILDDDDDDCIELDCFHCGEELYFDTSILEDDDVIEIICPKCNEVVFINDGSFDFEHTEIGVEESGFVNPNPS